MRQVGVFLILLMGSVLVSTGLVSCASSPPAPYPPPTPTLIPSLAETLQAAQAAAQATMTAGQAAMVGVNLTATTVALDMQRAAATQNAVATATAVAIQATAQSQQATATAQARGTATAIAVEAIHAEATRQAFVLSVTQQAATLEATATAQVLQAQATALAAQAEREQLAVEQQRMMNQVWAVTKWAVLIIAFLVIVFLLHRLTALRVVKRDNGKVLVVMGGGRMVYDPDRNPAPVLEVDGGHARLPRVSEAMQAATTARDQAIALALAIGQRRRVSGQQIPATTVATQSIPANITVEVLPPERLRSWLEDVERQLPPPVAMEDER